MSEEYLTFSSVYFEDTLELAKKRLEWLRKTDSKHQEIKAYIIPVDGKFRVLRKIKIMNIKY